MTVDVPMPLGVNSPPAVILPLFTDHVTDGLKFPVPVTMAEQFDVPVVEIDPGEHTVVTDTTDTGIATLIVADPDFVISCVEVAVINAVPAVAGVNSPTLLIVPMPDGLTDQVTVELKLPVPVTAEVHVAV